MILQDNTKCPDGSDRPEPHQGWWRTIL